MHRALSISGLTIVLPLLLPIAAIACGGGQSSTNVPPNPSGTGTWNNTMPPPPPPTTGTSTLPPPPPPTNTGTLPPPPPAGNGSTATPLDPNAAGAAGLALMAMAATDAPGMAKEGAPMAGTFQDGQTLAQPITIQPGKCYTFIAAGVGPQQLEIQLVATTPFPGLAPMMGDQTGAGGKVVLGPGAKCIKLALIPVPVPAQWVIKATKGGGVVAGQAYSK
ncbi:MAG TPA: hypothetical protein VIF15_10740 [Polyangiaceae bacterium]